MSTYNTTDKSVIAFLSILTFSENNKTWHYSLRHSDSQKPINKVRGDSKRLNTHFILERPEMDLKYDLCSFVCASLIRFFIEKSACICSFAKETAAAPNFFCFPSTVNQEEPFIFQMHLNQWYLDTDSWWTKKPQLIQFNKIPDANKPAAKAL